MAPQQHSDNSTDSLFSQAGQVVPEPTTAPAAPEVGFGLIFQTPDLEFRVPRREPQREAPEVHQAQEEPADSGQGNRNAGPSNDNNSGDDDNSTARSRRRGGRGRRKPGDTDQGEQQDSASASRQNRGDASDASTDDDSDADATNDTRSSRGSSNTNSNASNEPNDGPDSDDKGDSDDSRRRTRRRRRSGSGTDGDDPPNTVTKVREPRKERDEVQSIKGSTRLEAKKQRRREGRDAGRRRTVITEAEFLARRESVERLMVVRERDGRTQIGVLEDGLLAEHYVSRETQQASMAGNVYLGRVQNVLPSMEAAFVDIGRGRNAVLYAGEVNWDAAGLDHQAKRIENALSSGESVLVQVTKDPIGHKGARLTSQISLPGRFLVYVPGNSMTGISRKLPEGERARLKKILKEIVPAHAGVIVRTAAEGASEEDLKADIERLQQTWEEIQAKSKSGSAPSLLHGEPDLTLRVIRDVFNEDFSKLIIAGDKSYDEVSDYLGSVAPDLAQRVEKWTGTTDLFTVHRVDEQLTKALDRKVWLPSGGSLVIDRTEAMTVIDVNTGKYIGSGGNLEETVTRNNLEAAEEIVRQLRLRDIGGIIVVDFIDMVLESNRDLVVRRLLECLGRDRTKHQVAEVTSLGLVQMTRKRVGSGLLEIFSEPCVHCDGRGIVVHDLPVDKSGGNGGGSHGGNSGGGNSNGNNGGGNNNASSRRTKRGRKNDEPEQEQSGPSAAQIAAAAHAAALAGDKKVEDVLAEVEPIAQKVQQAAEKTEATPARRSEPKAERRSEPKTEPKVAPTVAAIAPIAEPASAPAEEQPAKRRRGSRRAASPSVAPVAAQSPVEVPVTVTAAQAAAAEVDPAPVAQALAKPPVKRRPKRARVVAPAGPPVNLESGDPTE
ncbi:hypothetical protein GCM10027579_04440 [Calidifontibacter terrae]